jgi:hypothetical protein
MPTEVCSLKVEIDQPIRPNVWTIVRFPFDSSGESTDPLNMHDPNRPPPGGPVTNWQNDDRSGLIWPSSSAWGLMYSLIQWADPGVQATCTAGTEFRDQYVRDPLGYTSNPVDTTATDHRTATPGIQTYTKSWGIFVSPTVPLALRVRHDASGTVNLTLAEFKLAIIL